MAKEGTEKTLESFAKKFKAKVIRPWDGKTVFYQIGPSKVLIGVRKQAVPDEAELYIKFKDLGAICERDVFDIPMLSDAGLLSVIDKVVIPKGGYRGTKTKDLVIYPSGIPQIDVALIKGGFYGGYVSRLWGASQGLKTVIMHMTMITAWYLYRKPSLLIDLENSFDEERFCALGGEEMYYSGNLGVYLPGSGEDAYEETLKQVQSGRYAIAGVDSITGGVTEHEMKKSLSKEPKYGEKARLQTRFIEKVLPYVARSSTNLMLIAQARQDSSGDQTHRSKVAGTYSEGGSVKAAQSDSIEFYVTQSIKVRPQKAAKTNDKGDIIGAVASGLVDKNRKASPGRRFEFFVDYERGVDVSSPLINLGIEAGAIELDGKAHVISSSGEIFKSNSVLVSKLNDDQSFRWQLYKEVMLKKLGKSNG